MKSVSTPFFFLFSSFIFLLLTSFDDSYLKRKQVLSLVTQYMTKSDSLEATFNAFSLPSDMRILEKQIHVYTRVARPRDSTERYLHQYTCVDIKVGISTYIYIYSYAGEIKNPAFEPYAKVHRSVDQHTNVSTQLHPKTMSEDDKTISGGEATVVEFRSMWSHSKINFTLRSTLIRRG